MHAKGMEGVDLARQILESTTWIELSFTAADNEPVCTLERLDGIDKAFDAMGAIFREKKTLLYVECKNYDVVGNQAADYTEFLANAYSITARDIQIKGLDARREFMWFTTHPFSQTKWSRLAAASEIRAALEVHPEVLDGGSVDDDILATVADRIWLLIVNHKQAELTLSSIELNSIEGILNRKGR